MYIPLLILICIILNIFLYRYLVFKEMFLNYKNLCKSFCKSRNKDDIYLTELTEIWPMRHVIFDISYWKIDKYIINQDRNKEMMKDIEREALGILEQMIKKMRADDSTPIE